jgi:hypothetical protein
VPTCLASFKGLPGTRLGAKEQAQGPYGHRDHATPGLTCSLDQIPGLKAGPQNVFAGCYMDTR